MPLILDVDTGIDDALALLYACASPEAELVAVTCSAGNVDAARVAENTRAVLELAGRPDVEVAIGREAPLARPLETTPETHGPRGIGWAELPAATMPLSSRPSPDLIVEEARRRPGELVLVTLAPLTNVALALRLEPDLPRLLRRLVIMGGAYGVPGNTTPVSEWNVHVDPEAAQVVFRAWAGAVARSDADALAPGDEVDPAGRARDAERGPAVPLALGLDVTAAASRAPSAALPLALGLDVTERARMLPDHVARLAEAAGCDGRVAEARVRSGDAGAPDNAVLRYVADSLRFYMEFHERYDGFYGAFVHDPFVVAIALDESLVRAEPVTVDVETAGEIACGQTIADWRHLWHRPANALVGVDADAETFLERLIDRVGRLARDRG